MNKRRKAKPSRRKTFVAVVNFYNEGRMYGSARFTVRATNRRAAREQARKVAQASRYNDERIPDRKIVIDISEGE